MKRKKMQFIQTHPAVTSNILIFSIHDNTLMVLLWQRKHEPFKNYWAIPGGLIHLDESLEDAARRILEERTGIHSETYIEQLYTFGDPKRDPRERRINVTYFALVPFDTVRLSASPNHYRTEWFAVTRLPKLAFDHRKIIQYGVERTKAKIGYSNIAHGLLPEQFRLSDLQQVYETLLGKTLDKRNFRKKMLSLGLLKASGRKMVGRHRPAMLYKFKTREIVFFD